MTLAQSQYPCGFEAFAFAHGVHGVGGSNPLAPTNRFNESGQPKGWPFSFLKLLYPLEILLRITQLS
jgi:hypothetical protein